MKYIRNLELNERTKSIKTEENKIEKKNVYFYHKIITKEIKKKSWNMKDHSKKKNILKL